MKKKLPGSIKMPELTPPPPVNLEDYFDMKDESGTNIRVRALDLVWMKELGRGAYGVVEKMRHPQSNMIFAVKRIHSSVQDENQKRMFVELDACMKSGLCPELVRFFGAMYREGDVWICMEVMDVSLDKFYRMCYDLDRRVPEPFIGRVALAVVEGLNFMKEKMNLIHRDVKPSNVLLDRCGEAKLCDFGISGHLTNSVAKTVNAGCKPYMPPERIDGETKDAYGVQADVWSLGITLMEVATGSHPYSRWRTPFEQLKQVVQEDAPRLGEAAGYSDELNDFVNRCLTKDFRVRPKHKDLIDHPLLLSARANLKQQRADEKATAERKKRQEEGLQEEKPDSILLTQNLASTEPPSYLSDGSFSMAMFITWIIRDIASPLTEKSLPMLSVEFGSDDESGGRSKAEKTKAKREKEEEEEPKPGCSKDFPLGCSLNKVKKYPSAEGPIPFACV